MNVGQILETHLGWACKEFGEEVKRLVNENRKKLENIAREVCKNGNSSGIVFNAANEIAVKNFLEDEISFNQIYDVIYRTFETTPMSNITDIESIYEKDIESRMEAEKVVKSLS